MRKHLDVAIIILIRVGWLSLLRCIVASLPYGLSRFGHSSFLLPPSSDSPLLAVFGGVDQYNFLSDLVSLDLSTMTWAIQPTYTAEQPPEPIMKPRGSELFNDMKTVVTASVRPRSEGIVPIVDSNTPVAEVTIPPIPTSAPTTMITLLIDDIPLLVSKFVLCARSPTFRAMLTSTMRESEEKVIELKDVAVAPMRVCIYWMYCGDIELKVGREQ